MRWLSSCFLAAPLLAACVPTAEVHLFNNLPVAVVVATCDTTVEIPPAAAAVLSTYRCAWQDGELVVTQQGAQWRYTGLLYSATWLFQHNPEFAKGMFPSGSRVRAQLEPTGTIFFVKPDAPVPTKDLADALRIPPTAGAEG